MNFIFHVIYGIILLIDFHIFQRGWNHQPDDLTMKNTVKNIHEKLADKAGWLVTFCGNFIIYWDFTTILIILYVLYVDGVSGKPKPNPCKIPWLGTHHLSGHRHGWSLGVIKRGKSSNSTEVSFAGHHGTSMVDFRTFDHWITAWSPAKSQQKT